MKFSALGFTALHLPVGLCSPLMAPTYEVRSVIGDESTSGAVLYPVKTPSISRDLDVGVPSEHPEDKMVENRAIDWSQLSISDDCIRCATSAASAIGFTIFNGHRIIRGSIPTANFAGFGYAMAVNCAAACSPRLTGHTFATNRQPAQDKTQREIDWIVFVTGG